MNNNSFASSSNNFNDPTTFKSHHHQDQQHQAVAPPRVNIVMPTSDDDINVEMYLPTTPITNNSILKNITPSPPSKRSRDTLENLDTPDSTMVRHRFYFPPARSPVYYREEEEGSPSLKRNRK